MSRVRGTAQLIAWWLLFTAGYLGLVSSPTGWEIPLALVIGGAATLTGVLGRRAFDPAGGSPSFVRRAVWLPLDVVTDAVALIGLLLNGRALRADCGELDEVTLPDEDESTRAWAVLLASASPGSLTVDVEPRDGRTVLLRHRLTSKSRAAADLEGR